MLSEDKFVMLEKLHLVKDGYLTNAAMLLFSNDPEKWQLGAYVKIGFFETDSDLVYQDEIHGSILDQIDKIVEIIYLKYMKAQFLILNFANSYYDLITMIMLGYLELNFLKTF